jgi:hypothetical protein
METLCSVSSTSPVGASDRLDSHLASPPPRYSGTLKRSDHTTIVMDGLESLDSCAGSLLQR